VHFAKLKLSPIKEKLKTVYGLEGEDMFNVYYFYQNFKKNDKKLSKEKNLIKFLNESISLFGKSITIYGINTLVEKHKLGAIDSGKLTIPYLLGLIKNSKDQNTTMSLKAMKIKSCPTCGTVLPEDNKCIFCSPAA
jgi:hypothetical protein